MKNIIIFIMLIIFSNTIHAIEDKKEIKIAVFPFKPLIFQNEQGKADGFFYDIIENIAEKEGWKTKYIFGTWKDGLERIKKGEVDIVTSCAYTDDRKEFMDYTKESAFTMWSQVFSQKGLKVNSIFELKDKKIGLMKNDFNGSEFIQLTQKFNIKYKIIYFDTFTDIYKSMDNGSIDAGVTAVSISYAMEKEHNFEKTPIVFNPFNLYFTVKKGSNYKYAEIIDKHLKELKSNHDSFYYKSLDYWIGIGKDTKFIIPSYIIYGGIILVSIIIVLILISYFFQHKVTEATKEINQKNSELKIKMDEIVEQRNRAEKASKIKSEFLANMSHEIRTPLNGIAGMTELLEYTEMSNEQKFYIDNLKASCNNLIIIVDDILDISKIESGNAELQIIEFKLNEIFDNIKKNVSYQAEKQGINLIFDIESTITYSVKGDFYKIKQILMNLTTNAVKFTNKEGMVKVSVRMLSEKEDKIELEFKVKDTGIGIKDDIKENIFQPFEQGDSSLSKKYQGMGLGLSISKRNAEIMGGELFYNSKVGEGTEFFLRVELLKAKENEKENIKQKFENLEKNDIKVLIAEDNYINMEMTVRMLKMCGNFIIFKALNGREVIEIYKKEKNIDVIFMDIQMPEINGMEAFELIKKESKEKDIKKPLVIAMTAYATKSDINKFLNVGMDDFISKPFILDDIKKVLKKFGIYKKYIDNIK